MHGAYSFAASFSLTNVITFLTAQLVALPIDLFLPLATETAIHPQFRALRDSSFHVPARALMNNLYARMGDPNGCFLRDFQGKQFHARVFELACFAYLESAGLAINRSYERPDFFVARDEYTIGIEATTANPQDGHDSDISVGRMPELPEEELVRKVEHEFPRRMISILRKKLKHRYHLLPHLSKRPIVLMVAPFFEPGAPFYVDDNLVRCLYGGSENAGTESDVEPFFSPTARPISAVLYCNAFTVPRFFRLAPACTHDGALIIRRAGSCYLDDAPQSVVNFEYRVGGATSPKETWAEGVTLFENPNASIPLPKDFLPATSRFSIRQGKPVREVEGFHPLASFMTIHIPSA